MITEDHKSDDCEWWDDPITPGDACLDTRRKAITTCFDSLLSTLSESKSARMVLVKLSEVHRTQNSNEDFNNDN